MEESADAKELKLGKIQEELHALKYKLQDMEDQMQALRKAIDNKESEIAGAVLMEGIEVEMDAAEQPTKSVADLTRVSKNYRLSNIVVIPRTLSIVVILGGLLPFFSANIIYIVVTYLLYADIDIRYFRTGKVCSSGRVVSPLCEHGKYSQLAGSDTSKNGHLGLRNQRHS